MDREQEDPEHEQDVVGALGQDVREAELEIRPDDLAARHREHVRAERVGLALGGAFEPLARGLGVALGLDRQHVRARSAGVPERECLRAGGNVAGKMQRELGQRSATAAAPPGGQDELDPRGRTGFPSNRSCAPLIAPAISASIRRSSSGVRFSIRLVRPSRQRRPEPGRQVLAGRRWRRRCSRRPFRRDEDADRSELVGAERFRGQREAEDGERDGSLNANRRRGRRRPSGRSGSCRSPGEPRTARHPRGLRSPRAFRSRASPFLSLRTRRRRP